MSTFTTPRVGDIYKCNNAEWQELIYHCYIPSSYRRTTKPFLLCSRIAGNVKGKIQCDYILISPQANGTLVRGLVISYSPTGTLVKHLRKPTFMKLAKGMQVKVNLNPKSGNLHEWQNTAT